MTENQQQVKTPHVLKLMGNQLTSVGLGFYPLSYLASQSKIRPPHPPLANIYDQLLVLSPFDYSRALTSLGSELGTNMTCGMNVE